ncbi:uncharacterized protein LOC108593240 [Callithrix jacchus]
MAGGGGARGRAGSILASRSAAPSGLLRQRRIHFPNKQPELTETPPSVPLLLLLSSRRRCHRLPSSRPAPPLRRRGVWHRLAQPQPEPAAPSPRTRPGGVSARLSGVSSWSVAAAVRGPESWRSGAAVKTQLKEA